MFLKEEIANLLEDSYADAEEFVLPDVDRPVCNHGGWSKWSRKDNYHW